MRTAMRRIERVSILLPLSDEVVDLGFRHWLGFIVDDLCQDGPNQIAEAQACQPIGYEIDDSVDHGLFKHFDALDLSGILRQKW